MYIIKDHMIVNLNHITKIEKSYETYKGCRHPYKISIVFGNGEIEYFLYENEYNRDLGFLCILQSITQDLTTCFMDSDVTKYHVANNTNLMPKKKKKIKDA